ncbi:hypothetical protein GCM10009601_14720 [Streptomyces thermospinosisporus]|uniref:Extensin n=1 Tax=Streptomyces thermospinosisporus TaxID=161482 RepID=A0ABP4JCS8_9ACTN
MADEQHRWLDRDTAERLLSGLPPEAADPAAREKAERLARTLGALTPPPLTCEELPGEAAALAAFRKAREEREGRFETAGAERGGGARTLEAGLVRIGGSRPDATATVRRSRWTRPVRLALAAAMAAGMVGGAAALAGTGAFPGPAGDPGTDPAASVTASATPNERPLVTPPPDKGTGGGATPDEDGGRPSQGAAGSAQPGGPATSGDQGQDTGAPAAPGTDSKDPGSRAGRGWKETVAACRALREGRHLDGDRRRLLQSAAGDSARVGRYCKGVLAAAGYSSKFRKGDQDSRERSDSREGSDSRDRTDDGGDADKDGDKRGGHGRHGDKKHRHGGKNRYDRNDRNDRHTRAERRRADDTGSGIRRAGHARLTAQAGGTGVTGTVSLTA